uniref:Uncharacterized protein n=1 Tax=Lotus japonicus TaxID=34305 RepID=I3S3Z1_LOTJA|nr:unknown [Lotus japonicus]
MLFGFKEDNPLSRSDSMEHSSRISSRMYTASLSCCSQTFIGLFVICFSSASSTTALISSRVFDSFLAFPWIPDMVANSF